jgi:3-hydroxyacyl-CoA dehydrogenase/enoyl-CoA hydratase/3-hydroxybutyryl-CoA epimerase
MTETIKFDLDSDGIATLTIDLPDATMNVVNQQFLSDLAELVKKVTEEEAVKGAVIISAKPSFMAGADLRMLGRMSKEARKMGPEERFKAAFSFSKLLREMETSGKAFVAAVHGLALGGGLELVLACHYRVLSDHRSTKLGLPEVLVGLLPGAGGMQRLTRLAGMQVALQYASTGKNLSAMEAVALKVADVMVPEDKLVETAKAWLLDKPQSQKPWDKKGFKIPGGGGAMHPNAVRTMIGASAMAQDKSWHNYPAVEAILSAIYEGAIVPFDTAIRLDAKRFANLMAGDVAPNMIRTLFVNKLAAERGAKRPEGMEKKPIKKLGMLGAGMMGAGIAYVSARGGMEVVLLDSTLEAAERGKALSEKLVEKGVKRNKTTKDEGEALLGRIHPTTEYVDLEGCDLVIEAVFEDREIKADVTKKTEAVIGQDCIMASNTSTLPITGLAEASRDAEKFIGMHFFSPVEKMPLVEIILGNKTGDEALARALDYVAAIKKTPIVVNDSRGFYTSRCFGTYVKEGAAMLKDGIKPALIENAGRLSGMMVGPLAVADEVSLELSYNVMTQAKKDLGEDYPGSPADDVIIKFVEDLDRKGRKNGKGFYEYPEGGKKYLWPEIANHFPEAAEQPHVDEVKTRILYRQAIEAARCFEEGVLDDAPSADVGAILGWGYAPYTGGPLSFIDTIGAKDFVAEADRLAEAYGPRFAPPKLLRDMAEKGESFY